MCVLIRSKNCPQNRYNHYLAVDMMASSEDEHRAWVGWVESRLRKVGQPSSAETLRFVCVAAVLDGDLAAVCRLRFASDTRFGQVESRPREVGQPSMVETPRFVCTTAVLEGDLATAGRVRYLSRLGRIAPPTGGTTVTGGNPPIRTIAAVLDGDLATAIRAMYQPRCPWKGCFRFRFLY